LICHFGTGEKTVNKKGKQPFAIAAIVFSAACNPARAEDQCEAIRTQYTQQCVNVTVSTQRAAAILAAACAAQQFIIRQCEAQQLQQQQQQPASEPEADPP
jgi:hypothetical protein